MILNQHRVDHDVAASNVGLFGGYCCFFTYPDLVGGLEHFLFFHILGKIIPTDELIFFRGVGIPVCHQPEINVVDPMS